MRVESSRAVIGARRVRFELEVIPQQFHEDSRDWSELAATRVLTEPLFFELPRRRLKSRIFERCTRLSDDEWELEISEEALSPEGSGITSMTIAQQILRARKAREAGLLASLMFRWLKPMGRSRIRLGTRVPLADISHILANPALAPHASRTRSRAVLLHQSKQRLVVQSRANRQVIEFSPLVSRGRSRFLNGDVDVTGPMSLSPGEPASSTMAVSCFTKLDFYYGLVCPPTLARTELQAIHRGLDRHRSCEPSRGLVTPLDRIVSLWSEAAAAHEDRGRVIQTVRNGAQRRRPLAYTAFPGNREVALGVAESLTEMGYPTKPVARSYGRFLRTGAAESGDSFRLVVIPTLWPHPTGALAPFYFGEGASPSFREHFAGAAAAKSLREASQHARRAENELVERGTRVVPVGRPVGCVRSRIGPLWCPPSGWMPLSEILDSTPSWDGRS